MQTKISMADVLKLTPEERLTLVEEIWDSIAAVPEAIQLTDAQRRELEARLAEHRATPDAASPWRGVAARVRQKLKNPA